MRASTAFPTTVKEKKTLVKVSYTKDYWNLQWNRSTHFQQREVSEVGGLQLLVTATQMICCHFLLYQGTDFKIPFLKFP